MVKGFLEQRITDALQKNGIIEEGRTPIVYRPEGAGYGYKKFRQWAIRNAPTIALAGIGATAVGAGITAYTHPELAKGLALGIGAASGLGVIYRVFKPLDRWLCNEPEDIAKRYFQTVDVPWREAYDHLGISCRRELDGYVFMAQTVNKLAGERVHHETQLTMGIAVAKTADFLSGLDFNSRLPGLSLTDVIEIAHRQKLGDEIESKVIDELIRRTSPRKLARMIKRVKQGRMEVNSVPGLPVLYEHLRNYEFILRTSACEQLEGIGSQLSRGELMITNDVGPNAVCYAGMYSKGKDCPRVKVKDDADHSFGTHSSRLFGIVGGNIGQGAIEDSTGAILVVEGTAEHHFAHRANDSTFPMIAITVGGLTQRLDEVKNGIVGSLAEDKLLRNSGEKAVVYRFRDGKKEKIELPIGENDEQHHEAPETLRLAELVDAYIDEWAERHGVAA